MEKLIRTPSIDEALAFIEAYLFGQAPGKLCIVGAAGSGKTFLADWARAQTKNGRRGSIFDQSEPPAHLPFWLVFTRDPAAELAANDIIQLGAPEYERKAGVLSEWALARGVAWQARALEALLAVPTDNLQRLRSLAERILIEAASTSGKINEVDVLRTLARVGYLDNRQQELPGLLIDPGVTAH